jgi:hypothetical protein
MLHRNCLLNRVIERKVEERGRRGRRRKQLLGEVRETRRYWKLKEEALDHIVLSGEFASEENADLSWYPMRDFDKNSSVSLALIHN